MKKTNVLALLSLLVLPCCALFGDGHDHDHDHGRDHDRDHSDHDHGDRDHGDRDRDHGNFEDRQNLYEHNLYDRTQEEINEERRHPHPHYCPACDDEE